MIRVTIEVDETAHRFTITRESISRTGVEGNSTTERLESLICSAQASMNAALQAIPLESRTIGELHA